MYITLSTVDNVHYAEHVLVCRFLHQNLIKRIENLDHLQYLDTLNLSHNHISRLANLSEMIRV